MSTANPTGHSSASTCQDLRRFRVVAGPGEMKSVALTEDFCLTDVVIDFAGDPTQHGRCELRWVPPGGGLTPSGDPSEVLMGPFVDIHGVRIHLNSGLYFPAGSSLVVHAGTGSYTSHDLLLTGFAC